MTSLGTTVFGGLIVCTVAFILTVDGKPKVGLVPLIVSGNEARDRVPFIVSIQYKTEDNKWAHFCGGSIISPSYVLTAARCLLPHFRDNGLKGNGVYAGANSLSSRLGSRHRIVSYTSHPKYKDIFHGYDIGLVKVFPQFKFCEETVAKISLNSYTDHEDGDLPVVFYGWGRTEFGIPDHLHTSKFKTMSQDNCRSNAYENLSSTYLCAFSEDNTVASEGDFGGPLLNENKDAQIGIFSHYFDVNLPFPSVLTKVSEFREWIYSEIGEYLPFYDF